MGQRLIAEDCDIIITDLGTTASPTSNAIDVTLFARSVKGGTDSDKVARVDGIGETVRKQRGAKTKNDYTVDLLIDVAYPVSIPVFNNISIAVAAAGISFTGMLMKNDISIPDGQEVIQTLEITDGA